MQTKIYVHLAALLFLCAAFCGTAFAAVDFSLYVSYYETGSTELRQVRGSVGLKANTQWASATAYEGSYASVNASGTPITEENIAGTVNAGITSLLECTYDETYPSTPCPYIAKTQVTLSNIAMTLYAAGYDDDRYEHKDVVAQGQVSIEDMGYYEYDTDTGDCTKVEGHTVDIDWGKPVYVEVLLPLNPYAPVSSSTTTSAAEETTSSTTIPDATTTTSAAAGSTTSSSSTTTSQSASTTTTSTPGSPCVAIGGLNLCASSADKVTKAPKSPVYTLRGPGVNINGALFFDGTVTYAADADGSATGTLSTSSGIYVPMSGGDYRILAGGAGYAVDGVAGTLMPTQSVSAYAVELAGIPLFGNNAPVTVTPGGVMIEPMIYLGSPDFAIAKASLRLLYEPNGSVALAGAELINGQLTPSISFMAMDVQYSPSDDRLDVAGQIAFPFMGTWAMGGSFTLLKGCLDAFEGALGAADAFGVPLGPSGLKLIGGSMRMENICADRNFFIFLGGDIGLEVPPVPSEILMLSKMGLGYQYPWVLMISSGTAQVLGYGLSGLSGKINFDLTNPFILVKGRTTTAIADVFEANLNLGFSYKRSIMTGNAWGKITIPDFSCNGTMCKIAKALIRSQVNLPFGIDNIQMDMTVYESNGAWTGSCRGITEVYGYKLEVILDYADANFDLTVIPYMSVLRGGPAGDSGSHMASQAVGAEQGLELAEKQEQVVFAAIGNSALPSIHLTTPQGADITPENAGASGVAYFGDADTNVAFFTVTRAAAGLWTMGATNLAQSEVTFYALGAYQEPATAFTSVSLTGSTLDIALSVTPAGADTTVSLFYTDDPESGTGVLLSRDLSAASGTVADSIQTSAMPDGTYYLFAKTDDGLAPPVTTRYKKAIVVNNSGTEPPTGLKGVMSGDTARLTWRKSASETVEGYGILYTDMPARAGYPYVRAATGSTGTDISGLDPGKCYRFCVVGYDDQGNATPQSNAVTLSSCPIIRILGADNPGLDPLRDFRDTRLARSAVGQRMIRIYYNNADSVNAALDRSPALRAVARRVLEALASRMGAASDTGP